MEQNGRRKGSYTLKLCIHKILFLEEGKSDSGKNVCVISNEMAVSWWERDSGKDMEGFDSAFQN